MSTFQVVLCALGGVLMLVVLAGFFRSFWQPAPKADEFRESGAGTPPDHGY
jgi:hypothetical protein